MHSYHASAPDGNLVVEAHLVRPPEIMPKSHYEAQAWSRRKGVRTVNYLRHPFYLYTGQVTPSPLLRFALGDISLLLRPPRGSP